TMIYTSHYMEEVEFLCDRIYIMDQGNLIASGTKEELKEILAEEKTVVIRAGRLNDAFIEALNLEPTVHQVTVEDKTATIIVPREVNLFRAILRMAENAGIELNSVDIQTPTLEDVFLHL